MPRRTRPPRSRACSSDAPPPRPQRSGRITGGGVVIGETAADRGTVADRRIADAPGQIGPAPGNARRSRATVGMGRYASRCRPRPRTESRRPALSAMPAQAHQNLGRGQPLLHRQGSSVCPPPSAWRPRRSASASADLGDRPGFREFEIVPSPLALVAAGHAPTPSSFHKLRKSPGQPRGHTPPPLFVIRQRRPTCPLPAGPAMIALTIIVVASAAADIALEIVADLGPRSAWGCPAEAPLRT